MRYCYIVVYDISDQKRVKKVFKVMKGFGEHLQYSVFLCKLDKKRLTAMRNKLLRVIDTDEDQIISINIGPEHLLPELDISHLGIQPIIETRSAVII